MALRHYILRPFRLAIVGYATWLGMMAVHESGHVLHAWCSGGHVERVMLPAWGFSRTDVWPNPAPRFVSWGGPIWGCLWPLAACAITKLLKNKVLPTLRFFTGFCLIANGSYLGIGWSKHSGDAWDLVQMGTPRWILIAFGITTVSAGLYIWHRLGPVSQLLD